MQGVWTSPPTLILNADSAGCLELRERLHDWTGRIITYAIAGMSQHDVADFMAYDVRLEGETSFRVRSQERCTEAFPAERVIHQQLPRMYNVQNALAALTAAHVIGLDAEMIIRTLDNFSVIGR